MAPWTPDLVLKAKLGSSPRFSICSKVLTASAVTGIRGTWCDDVFIHLRA